MNYIIVCKNAWHVINKGLHGALYYTGLDMLLHGTLTIAHRGKMEIDPTFVAMVTLNGSDLSLSLQNATCKMLERCTHGWLPTHIYGCQNISKVNKDD